MTVAAWVGAVPVLAVNGPKGRGVDFWRLEGRKLRGRLVMALADAGIAVHAFGAKGDGAVAIAAHAASCDSMAWSYRARREPPLPGCSHKSCANCPRYALAWRARLLKRIATPQLDLFGSAA